MKLGQIERKFVQINLLNILEKNLDW